MLTPVAPPGAEIPRLDALWNLLRTLLGFCWKAVEGVGGGFMHGVRAVAEHWPLLTVIFLAGLLVWLAWPVFSASFPRLAAWLWPHLPITLSILAFWGGVFALGVHLNFYLWSGAKTDWKHLAKDVPRVDLPRHDMSLEPLDWLWPWLPSLVALLALLWLAARYFSRRCFHALCATFLLSLLFGVTTHKEREEPTRPVPEAKVTDLVADRFGDRILNPLFHFDNTQPDLATLVLFGLGLMVGYVWLDRINLRQSLQPIRVTSVEDVDKKSRPDLEHLMRECLHRNTPHVPSPLPGGGLIYWQDFVEQQYTKDSHWFTRAAALAARMLRQPRGMEITGTLIHSREESTAPHAPHEDALKLREKFGVRIHMVDVYSRQTLMARTFWSTHKVEHAVEQAAYSAMQRAMEECRSLPEWAYWHEDDGQALRKGGAALREYHEGILKFGAGSGDPKAVSEALKHFKAAAWRSPGSALARLQIGTALEANNSGDAAVEVYLDLINRFPHLMMARFRLASVCRAVERWQKNLEPLKPEDPVPSKAGKDPLELCRWQRLQEALFTQPAVKMLRPDLLSVGKAWAEGRPRALGDWLKGWPAMLTRPDPEQLTDMMLVMANKSLQKLEKAGRCRALFWCLKNPAERRLFWRTVLWPPRRFRASYLTVKAARRCVQLRQLERWKAGGSWPNRLLRTVLHELCCFRAWLLAMEARASVRKRGHWLGTAHYQLACFYSLRIRDEGAPGLALKGMRAHAEAEKAQEAERRAQYRAAEALKQASASGNAQALREQAQRLLREAQEAQDRAAWHQEQVAELLKKAERAAKNTSALARDATEHLSCALRDPAGPFSTGTLKWLLNHVDLVPLRSHPSFGYWSRLFHMSDEEYKKAMQPG